MRVFQAPPMPTPAVPLTHACPYCPQVFDSIVAIARESRDGKPQCRHCQHKFTQSARLIHPLSMTAVHPLLLTESGIWQVPPCDQEEVRHYISEHSWEALFERSDHCIICARAFQTGRDILIHLARCHLSTWDASKTRMAEIVVRIRLALPAG